MRIGEVAETTSLSISNIRFYERKGLIEPARDSSSKYREYTEQDIVRLKQIILYRKMDLSIEHICSIMNDGESIEKVLTEQMHELEQKRSAIQGSIDLCQKLMSDENKNNMDTEYYLNYISEEEEKGIRFADIDELFDDLGAFTKVSLLQGDPHMGTFFLNKWVRRGIIILVLLMWIALPVTAIASNYLEDGNVSIPFIIYWVCMTAGVGIAFFRYRYMHNGEK